VKMCSGVALFKVDELERQIAALTEERDRLVDILRLVQYSVGPAAGKMLCVGCYEPQGNPCKSDCIVGNALKEKP